MALEPINVIRDCDTAIKARNEDFKRSFEIWEAYFAANGKQWPESKRQDLLAQERHPWQFDVLGPKVETLAGSLTAELPDMDWLPVEGEPNQAIEAVRERYYGDKELFNYNDEALLFTIRDGCIHSGWCQMKESKRYSETGNIAIERCRPNYIVPDSYWVTDNDRDLDTIFKIGYYTPEQILNLFPKRSKEIERAIEERKTKGLIYSSSNSLEQRDDDQKNFKTESGDQFRVIEKFYLKDIKTERLVGIKTLPSGQPHYMPFPVTKDRDMLQRFAEVNGLDWDNVSATEYRERKQFIATVTDLDTEMFLEEGETREQVNGLSFFHFTCQRYNGHDKGIAESILDAQRVINEKESYLLEYMAKAGGGSELWNSDLFADANARKRFVKNKNKFGHVEFLDIDGVRTPRIEVNPAQVPSAVFQEIQRMYGETLPMVSRVSDAMSAISSSEDSGVLLERKYQINRIGNVLYDKYVKLLVNNIGEAYYYQSQITYGDTQQEVKRRSGGSITINKKDYSGGMKVVINDMSSLPRSKVVVTESKSNPIYQLRKKMEVETIMKSIPPTDTLRIQSALGMYFESMSMNDQTRAQVEAVNEIEMKKAMLATMAEMSTYETQIKQNQAAGEQIAMSMVKMEQPQQPPAPQQSVQPQAEMPPTQSGPEPAMTPQQAQPAEMMA